MSQITVRRTFKEQLRREASPTPALARALDAVVWPCRDLLTAKRLRQVDSYLHAASRRIIDHLVAHQIGTLVMGKNAGWKQETQLGKRTNQTFVFLPHARFIQMLTYKAQLVDITVIVTEESYTSKRSFLDHEPLTHQERYAAKRLKRGLFQTATGKRFNADVNGA
jgi:IS605 OrfB family transposase